MAGSGMRIFNAHPAFARPGETFPLNPWEGTPIPGVAHLRWLARRRAALALRDDVAARRERPRCISASSSSTASGATSSRVAATCATPWEMLKFYLFVRKDHPRQGKHNALQKSAYFAMPVLGIIIVLSGLAIWKPVTLGFITRAVRELQVGALRPLRRDGAAARCSRSSTSSWCSPWIRTRCARSSRAGTTARGRPKRATRGRSTISSARRASRDAARGAAPHDARPPALPHHLRRVAAAAALLAACDKNPEGAQQLLALAERGNERVEEGLFRHTAMNRVPASAPVAGASFPKYFISTTMPVWDRRPRRVAARGVGRGAPAALAHARRSDEAAAHHAEGRSLLRRGMERARRHGRACASATSRAPRRPPTTRSTWTSPASTRATTRAGTWRARCIRRRSSPTGWTAICSAPAHGAPARVHSPVKLGYKNTKYLTTRRVHAGAERRLLERSGLRVVRRDLMMPDVSRATNDPAAGRFEIRTEQGQSHCSTTSIAAPISIFSHRGPSRRSRGGAYGAALAAAALDYARREGIKVIPTCPYVKTYLAAPSGIRGSRRASLSAHPLATSLALGKLSHAEPYPRTSRSPSRAGPSSSRPSPRWRST